MPYQGSLSSHGTVEDPSSAAAAAGTGMVEGLVAARSWYLQKTDSAEVLEGAHTRISMKSILVVALKGFGTSQSARCCVVAVGESCSMDCSTADYVDGLLATSLRQTARRP